MTTAIGGHRQRLRQGDGAAHLRREVQRGKGLGIGVSAQTRRQHRRETGQIARLVQQDHVPGPARVRSASAWAERTGVSDRGRWAVSARRCAAMKAGAKT